MLTGVYAPCTSNSDEVKLFYKDIEEVISFWQVPWVTGGDFNEIRFVHERSSGSDYSTRMRKFNRFISRHQLIDLPLIGATYTWTNNQVQSGISRIDRILVSLSWESIYPNIVQQALSRHVSDHSPIFFICDGVKHGPSPFRCNPGFVFCKKIQLLKPKLRASSKEEYGELDRKLEKMEEIFTNLDAEENLNNSIFEAQWNERVAARQEYCRLVVVRAEK